MIILFITIVLQFVPLGPINNKPTISSENDMAPKPLFSTNDGLVYWCMYASIGLNELIVSRQDRSEKDVTS